MKKREYLFKIVVVGDVGVGKTSIIKRFVHNTYSIHYKATIGVDFALKIIDWDVDTIIRIQLWDVAGQERFGNLTRVYYRNAVGAFIVFDASRPETLKDVLKWKKDMPQPIPMVILANKRDLIDECVNLDDFCSKHGFLGWVETSAKMGTGIEEGNYLLMEKILQEGNEERGGDDDLVDFKKGIKREKCC